MSHYTTQVRFICESSIGLTESAGQLGVNEIVQAAIPKVFDFDFPIFDESYRNVLCTKILKHFYTREICAETVGLWKLMLDTKLNEIMPFYNQLYKSELLEFNPFYDVDLTRQHKLEKEETTAQDVDDTMTNSKNGKVSDDTHTAGDSRQDNESSTDLENRSNSTSANKTTGIKNHTDRYSDTPQGSLQNIANDTYLTNARLINDTNDDTANTTVTGDDSSTGSSTGSVDITNSQDTNRDITTSDTEDRSSRQNLNRNITSLDKYIETVKGKNGGASYMSLLNEFRNTFLNIDMQIINELNELFFNLW